MVAAVTVIVVVLGVILDHRNRIRMAGSELKSGRGRKTPKNNITVKIVVKRDT